MTFEVNGHEYSIRKIDAIKQFHIARRIAPVLGGIMEAQAAGAETMEGFLPAMIEAVGKMSDVDTEYVINNCLLAVQRKHGDGWTAVMSKNGARMFDDMDLKELLTIVGKVIQENMGDFFPSGGISG